MLTVLFFFQFSVHWNTFQIKNENIFIYINILFIGKI